MRQELLYVKLVLTAVFWGGTFVAGRVIAQQVPPFSAAFLRFVVASAVLGGFVWRAYGRIPLLKPPEFVAAVLLGLTGVFAYNAFFFLGLKTATASRASVIIANNPVFIALGSAVFFRERFSGPKVVGILLALCGAVTVITHGRPLEILAGDFHRGELYIFGCVLSWVLYSLIGKVAMRELPPLVIVTYACAIGTAFLALPAHLEGLARNVVSYSGQTWLGVGYLGFFGSALGFIWYYQGIQRIGPSRAAVFINLVPVSGVILASLILQETLDRSLWVGGGLVAAGVYLTNRPISASDRHQAA